MKCLQYAFLVNLSMWRSGALALPTNGRASEVTVLDVESNDLHSFKHTVMPAVAEWLCQSTKAGLIIGVDHNMGTLLVVSLPYCAIIRLQIDAALICYWQ
jgi:hypothetical protein